LILVDTSVWVDHLRRGEAELADLLEGAAVLVHPFVIGEIACGNLADRELVLQLLQDLPSATVAEPDEVLGFIESRDLHGKGIGHVDVHLLASVALMPGAVLWTRDKRLNGEAQALGCAYKTS
jgi:predicted nucleic acid-binding protein